MKNYRMEFKLVLGKGEEIKYELEDLLKISETKLNDNLSGQPTWYARFATLAARSRSYAERQEYKLEEYEQDLDLKMREQIEKSGKKVTENRIKAMIKTDSERLALVNRVIRAKEQYEIVNAAREAFNHRKDCLISIGANWRAEHEVDLTVKKRK